MAARTALVLIGGQVQQLPAGDALAGALAASAAGGVVSSGSLSFANSNGVSFGIAGQTITASAAPGPSAGIGAVSAGTQLATSGTIVFANSNGVSFGMSGSSQLTASVAAAAETPFGISAGTQSVSTGTLLFANANGISFGMSGSSQVTAKFPSMSYWENNKNQFVANQVAPSSNVVNLSIQRLVVPNQISATEIDLLAHLTVAASTAGSFTILGGMYTMSGSTASMASSSSAVVTFNSGTNATAASIYGAHSGTRWRSMPTGTWNVTPGEYMLAVLISINGPAGTTGSMTAYGGSSASVIQAVAGNNFTNYFADGLYSVGTNALPNSLHLSNINQSGNQVLRQPYVRFLGTF